MGMARAYVNSRVVADSSTVNNRRSPINSPTGVFHWKDMPKWPPRNPPTHLRYWRYMGRSSPYWARRAAASDSAISVPAASMAAIRSVRKSPGGSWMTTNETTDSSMTTRTMYSSPPENVGKHR